MNKHEKFEGLTPRAITTIWNNCLTLLKPALSSERKTEDALRMGVEKSNTLS